ncbi:adenylate kinase, partial [Cystoisospora suis]
MLKKGEEEIFLSSLEDNASIQKDESDSLEPTCAIYLEFSEMVKHYKIRKAIDPFFLSPDDPDTLPPLPDIRSILALAEDCQSLQEAPEDRRTSPPYSPLFPFLPPLPILFYGETGHYCPVSLRRQQWLLPGRPEFPVYIHQKVYFCHDEKTMTLFSIHPAEFIPSSYLLNEADEEEEYLQSQLRMYKEGRLPGPLHAHSSSSMIEGPESPRGKSDFYVGTAALDEQSNYFKSAIRKEVYTPPP